MATLADLLRQEQKNTLLKDIPWLPEEAAKDIRTSGRFVIICDKHIGEGALHNRSHSAIPNRLDAPVQQWAREKGFNACNIYNSYGVKMIEITL